MSRSIVIIGGGPGGYTAAIKAAKLGANVTLIENNKLGGTCLNHGCIPTKALYKNAEVINTINNLDKYGVNYNSSYEVNINSIHKRKNDIISTLVSGIEGLMSKNKINVIYGNASFIDNNTLLVNNFNNEQIILTWDSLIIATGSEAALLPIEGANTEGILTSTEILNFPKIYDNLTIIGGGVVGIEFAGIFNSFGSKVTVIEYEKNILTQLDIDISKRLAAFLKKKGIKFNTSSIVKKIEKNNMHYDVTFENKKGTQVISSEAVLLSAGRRPNISGLNIENTKIQYDRRGIIVNNYYETNIKNIYAIGDVNGKSMLAHSASHQGIAVIEKIMGNNEKSSTVIPGCVFSFPEAAFAGLNEKEVKEKGINYKVGKFQFSANGKALCIEEGIGFVKVIANMSDEIIGVHILGPHASDLIHEGVLAISNGLSVDDIKKTIHAHPTLSETFYEAVLDINGEAIHSM